MSRKFDKPFAEICLKIYLPLDEGAMDALADGQLSSLLTEHGGALMFTKRESTRPGHGRNKRGAKNARP